MYNKYDDLFLPQNGGGTLKHFVGSPNQRGHGIGSFLGGLFKRILPFLSSGAKAVGKEALRAGLNIATDFVEHDVPIKESLRHRFKESTVNLKRKAEEKLNKIMEGSGYKKSKRLKKKHSASNRRTVKTSRKKKNKVSKKVKKHIKKRTVQDIFA